MSLRAPDDDPDVLPLIRTDQVQLRPRLAGLVNEYQQSARSARPLACSG